MFYGHSTWIEVNAANHNYVSKLITWLCDANILLLLLLWNMFVQGTREE